MNHTDHVNLIKDGVDKAGVWAEFGSGAGAFTLALRDAAGPEIEIYSIDQDPDRLEDQEEEFVDNFPGSKVHFIKGDFTKKMDLPKLDGIMAANSLHFVKDKVPVLKLWKSYLKKSGEVLIVEYNADIGNQWVPYPFSFESLKTLAEDAGFSKPKLLSTVPSKFLDEIYAAEVRV